MLQNREKEERVHIASKHRERQLHYIYVVISTQQCKYDITHMYYNIVVI